MSNYDDMLDRKFEKECEENEKFCAWLEPIEKELMAEYAEENPDFDMMDDVWYSKFLDYANEVYDRQSL